MKILDWFASLLFSNDKDVEEGVWEVYKDRANSYRFRLKIKDETLVPSGQPYAKEEDAIKDINRVKEAAASASIKVLDA